MPKSRSTALFAFCIFFTVLGLSQSTEWKEFVYAEDGFAISAPLQPWIMPHYLDGGRGEGLLGHSYHFLARNQKGIAYGFILEATRRRDIDQRTPEQVLKDAKDYYASYMGTSFKLATPATLIYEKPVAVGNYPGVEFEMQHDNFRHLCRFYVVDRRVYSLIAHLYIQFPIPDDTERWYNSFRLIEAAEAAKQ